MSNAVTATGILVKRASTTIGEITQVTPPGFSRNKLESSTHNDGSESYVLGLLRQKDPSFQINYVGSDATHTSIVNDIKTNTKSVWSVVFPSGLTFSGDAYVQNFELQDAPVDAIQKANCTLSWAGPVTMT